MPHLTVHLPENRLTGKEPMLVAALTDAIVDVYGESARDLVSIRLAGSSLQAVSRRAARPWTQTPRWSWASAPASSTAPTPPRSPRASAPCSPTRSRVSSAMTSAPAPWSNSWRHRRGTNLRRRRPHPYDPPTESPHDLPSPKRGTQPKQALISVVATACLLGVSTRRVEELAESLGVTRLLKSQVSAMAKHLRPAGHRLPQPAARHRPPHLRLGRRPDPEGPRRRPHHRRPRPGRGGRQRRRAPRDPRPGRRHRRGRAPAGSPSCAPSSSGPCPASSSSSPTPAPASSTRSAPPCPARPGSAAAPTTRGIS
ncbi:hypothetical protein SGRIM128S_00383 [Streptomyces griseomycini]